MEWKFPKSFHYWLHTLILTTLIPESECGFSGGKNNFTDVTKIELGKKKTSLGEYPWVALIGNG